MPTNDDDGRVPERTPPLPDGVFTTIVADPPWRYDDVGAEGSAGVQYRTLPVEQIAALPVWRVAARNAHLYLWTTNSFLRQAFAVMEAWRFRYKTCLTWLKPGMGLGHYFRNVTEHVLFGVRGRLAIPDRRLKTCFDAPRTTHSTKPAAFYELVEKASPPEYLDLFARGPRPGWTVWGDEA